MGGKRFIVIAGNIGSGKTTLTKMLSDKYCWQPHFEVVTENPYLPDFYADMNRWSLQLQIYFLSKRFQAHQQILRSNTSAIQDRSIYEDAHIFARALHESGKMDERDYDNYFELYSTMTQFLVPPDLVVYIRRTVGSLKGNIKNRGRDYEKNIADSYLSHLHECYEDWIANHGGKVLTLDADDLDFRDRPEDFNFVCQSLENAFQNEGGLAQTVRRCEKHSDEAISFN